MHLPAPVTPSFSEDLISVAKLTEKCNKVLFTKKQCLLLGPSDTLDKELVVGKKGTDKVYRLQEKLTRPKKNHALKTPSDVPKDGSE